VETKGNIIEIPKEIKRFNVHEIKGNDITRGQPWLPTILPELGGRTPNS